MKNLFAAALLSLTACLPASAITWGEVDNNAHPNVGAIVRVADYDTNRIVPRASCTGTLIHPRVFLTAAHCSGWMEALNADGIAPLNHWRVSFGTNALDPSTWIEIEAIATYPGYREVLNTGAGAVNQLMDVGVLILKEPVTSITPARLAPEGLLDALRAQGLLRRGNQTAPFTVVGYGARLEWQPPTIIRGDGIRRQAESSYLGLNENWLFLSQNRALDDGGTGYGDSGGPTFWTSPRGEDYIVAVTSRGDAALVATGVAYRIDTPEVLGFLTSVVAAVESER